MSLLRADPMRGNLGSSDSTQHELKPSGTRTPYPIRGDVWSNPGHLAHLATDTHTARTPPRVGLFTHTFLEFFPSKGHEFTAAGKGAEGGWGGGRLESNNNPPSLPVGASPLRSLCAPSPRSVYTAWGHD